MKTESLEIDTTVGDWILEQCSRLTLEARERVAADFEAWQERDAIQFESRKAAEAAGVKEVVLARTTFEVETLGRKAEAVLSGPEQFPGQHWTARTLLNNDIPRWRREAVSHG